MAELTKEPAKSAKPAPTAEEFAAMQSQLSALQSQLTAAVVGGAIRTAFVPPPKFPKGLADWDVTVRHSQLPPGLKRMTVKADGPEAAWLMFLEEADKSLTHNRMNNEVRLQSNTEQTPQQRFAWVKGEVQAGKSWIAKAKAEKPAIVRNERGIETMLVAACEAELIGTAYAAARNDAMTVKGAVTRDQIGFDELATAAR